MDYKKIKNSDLKVSTIGIGTWGMGGDFFGRVNDQDSIRAIHLANDMGVNVIDTAPIYGEGHAERIVAKAIKGKRDKFIISTKCGVLKMGSGITIDLHPANIRREIEASLKRLEVETIDIYYLHWPDPSVCIYDSLDQLLKLKQQGKIRYIALSNYKSDDITKIIDSTPILGLQLQYNMMNQKSNQDEIKCALEHDLSIFSYGTLAGGILSGKVSKDSKDSQERRKRFYDYHSGKHGSNVNDYINCLRVIANKYDCEISQIAIAWVRKHSFITSALIGVKNENQVKDNIMALDINLSEKDMSYLDDTYCKLFM